MMCSSWKFGVFGIVALMLTFGLVAGDAWAHSDGHSEHSRTTVPHFTDATVTVRAISTETTDPADPSGNGGGRTNRDVNLLTAAPEDVLRATEVLDALVFTYTVGRTPVKDKAITITIPSGWTPATKDVNDGYNRDGEVELYVDGVLKRDKLVVTSRSMKFTGIDPVLETGDDVEFWFKRVKVPVRADTYEFGVITEMTGEKHVNRVNPHLLAHATQLAEDSEDPNAHTHGDVGTITLIVDEHIHPDDATHEHVDGNGVVDPPGAHTSHSSDHTHDADTETVVTVEAHRHPFADGMEPHRHAEDTGLVDTTDDDDIHTHDGTNPYTNTHIHNEDGTVVDAPDSHTHAADASNATSHAHDDGKTVKSVSVHNHDAAARDHEHDGNAGVTEVTDHATTSHQHTGSGTGPVDSTVNEGDHVHVGVTDPASIITATDHQSAANVHSHKSNRDVADAPTHSHQAISDDPDDLEDGEDALKLDHGHVNNTDDSRGDVVTVNGAAAGDHNTDLHTHASNGNGHVKGFTRTRHTHSTGTRDTASHEHSTIGNEGTHSNDEDVHRLEGASELHTLAWNHHTVARFDNDPALASVNVHVHTGPGRTVEWPDDESMEVDGEETNPWFELAGRIEENNIPFHTHASDGSAEIVTAHQHVDDSSTLTPGDAGYVADQTVEIEIFAHKHHSPSSTDTLGLTHGTLVAGDFITVTGHTHTAAGVSSFTVGKHHHDTTGAATAGSDKLTHAGDTPRTAGARAIKDVTTAHAHAGDVVDITVFQHAHAMKDDPDPIIVTDHYHDDDKTPLPLVEAHSHSADDSVRQFGAHEHVGVTAHKHEEGETLYDVIAVKAHTHASNRRVADVGNHIHPGGDTSPRIEGVDPREKHVHAILHNNKYAVRVGPVPSGSGELTLSNSGGATRLTKRTAEPYKGQYVVTKGQDLGSLMLTFKAVGTMVAGSGIRIELPDPNPGFPSFYEDNNAPGPPGGGGVRLARGSVEFSADPVNGDPNGYSSNALYLKTKSKLQAGDTFMVRVRDVMTKAHGDAPDKDPTTTVEGYSFTAKTASPLVPPTDTDPIVDSDLAPVGGPPVVVITGQHGIGEVALEARDPRDGLTQATTGEALGDVVLTFKAKQPMGKKSQVEVTIDPAWPTNPFPPADNADPRPGAVLLESDANAALKINGRVWTATIEDGLAVDDTLTFTYRKVKAPAEEGQFGFTTKSKAGPHGDLKLVGDKKNVDITTGHGSGTVTLRSGGRDLRSTPKETKFGALVFTYKAAGRMAKDALVRVTIPLLWTAPSYDNGDSRAAGVVTLSGTGKAGLEITGGGSQPWYLIAKLSESMTKDQTLVFTYRNVVAPGTPGSYTFTTSATAFPGALDIDDPGAELQSGSPEVGVDQAPDGSGTVVVTSSERALQQDTTGAYSVNVGETLGDLKFTFTATGKMESGGVVTITIPSDDGWDAPTYSNTGVTPAGAATHGVLDDTVTATLQSALEKGDTLVITYKSVTAPSSAGKSEFTMQSQSTTSGGELKNLTAGSPTIVVGDVPVGMLVITTADGELMSAGPVMPLGDVTLTFTATRAMSAGATVMITVPAGWTRPSEDVDDGVDNAGEVELTGSATLDVTGDGGALPWKLEATTTAALVKDDTLVFTYKMVTTPSTPGSYDFAASAAASATSDPVPIVQQPSTVIVRAVVTAIAIKADDSFFAGESLSGMVTLWSGTAAANALGDVVVMLSSDSETGSFTADSITIADDTNGAAFTYNDTAPGTVMLTATSGEGDTALTGKKEVTVKSGVGGLDVDPTLVKAGSDVTVTATGKAGGGTVKVMDSDGMQVGATKSLDPVVEPEEGDVTYSRTIKLPDDLADGTYTVTVDIQGLIGTMDIEVLNDQTPPTLSNAEGSKTVVEDGDTFTLSVDVAMNESMVAIDSVTADLGGLDTTQAEVTLDELPSSPGTYFTIITIADADANEAEDGEYTISITATDAIDNSSDPAMVTVSLANDPSELDNVSVPSDVFRPGEMVTITATGTAGQSAKFTVTSSDGTEMPSDQAMTEEPADSGTYVGTFAVVGDVHTEGAYDVTVTLNDNPAKSMTMAGSLNIGPAGYAFTLSIPAGTHIIHIPLAVKQINGEDASIDTVGDLYTALGEAVNYIITVGDDGGWRTYIGDMSAGTMADAAIGDDTGLVAVMTDAMTLELVGDALGTAGVSQINIDVGNNLVGVPLDPAVDMMISDALVEGVSSISVSNAAGNGFHTIREPGQDGDGPVVGGVGYLVSYIGEEATSIPIPGSAWENEGTVSAAPAVAFDGSQTPVLYVEGGVMDEFDMLSRVPELRVTVKNLSTGASLDTVLGTELSDTAYSGTFVELSRHAAKAGDVLEIVAHSPNPYVGVRPVQQIVVSAKEVLASRISLPDLELYEIPSETVLLANYPNPFNPETWIPYRLAQAAEVTLDIYDTTGRLVRTIDVGFKPAAVYESRASAIYWDGRNNYGERVASGTYFYHLTAGDDFSSTRRMVILK